jgi:hypothetical protein
LRPRVPFAFGEWPVSSRSRSISAIARSTATSWARKSAMSLL